MARRPAHYKSHHSPEARINGSSTPSVQGTAGKTLHRSDNNGLAEVRVNQEKARHCDSAKEFRGSVIGRACQDHDIAVERRPPRELRDGGHIERGFGNWLTHAAKPDYQVSATLQLRVDKELVRVHVIR
jgi:hypothetical protein